MSDVRTDDATTTGATAAGTDHERGRSTGTISVRGRAVRKTPLGWLPWTALLLAGILGLGALLIARNVGDAGDQAGVDLVDDPAAAGQDPAGPDANAGDGSDAGGARDASSSATGSSARRAPSSGAASTAAPAAGATSGITAEGQALLPIPSRGLAAFTGKAVEGKGVRVESVVADEGFWVGDSPSSRIFVFLTDAAKNAQGESPFQVKAGQTIDFSGTLQPLPDDLTPFGVDRSEGAEQLRQQGQYVALSRVTIAG